MRERQISARRRAEIHSRAYDRCEYCQTPLAYSPDPFVIEHILPLAGGGSSRSDNLALACHGCNGHKAAATTALDAETEELAPLYHPRHDRWRDHFAWSPNGTRMIGLTAIGRATIARLRLNRPGLINLRRVLEASDEHPRMNPVEASDL
jgi:hypothetical protein